jgi:hypothetical protein
MAMKSNNYYILDNGIYPFKVEVSPNNELVRVYSRNYQYDCAETLLFSIENPKEVLVGSPTIICSERCDSMFNGNSVLIHTGDLQYTCVTSSIYKFKAADKIVKFVSDVSYGNSPYPYAIDDHDRYYLLIFPETAGIIDKFKLEHPNNPYLNCDYTFSSKLEIVEVLHKRV